MEQDSKKVSFLKRIKWSIFNPENYDFFAVEKMKKAIAYFTKIVLIFALVTSIGITYKFTTIDFRSMPELQEIVTEETIEYIESIPRAEINAIFYFISATYLFIVYYVIIAVDVLLLSLLGYITSRIAKVALKYSAIANISIYALTLPVILNAIYIVVNSFTGFEIKYFQIMYNAVAYIYLVTAILMIKSEMIKQAAELAKLEEEQKRIREELARQEEEKKQKEEQKRKEREEEKQKKEQEKEKTNKNKKKEKKESEESPEGSMAAKKLDKTCKNEN